MTQQSNEPRSIDAQPTANGDASASHDATPAQTPPESGHVPQDARKASWRRKLLAGMLGVADLAVFLVFGMPWVEDMLNTVATDHAVVSGHATFVATPLQS
jgi:hypothetical protein